MYVALVTPDQLGRFGTLAQLCVETAQQFHRLFEKRVKLESCFEMRHGFSLSACRDQSRSRIHLIRSVGWPEKQDLFETTQSLCRLLRAKQYNSQTGQHRRVIL